MSYSLTGIDKESLSQRFFDFSWRGQDIYYNFQLLRYALKLEKFTDVKQVSLVFPYYYFSWDQSRSWVQYETGQIFGVNCLNYYHNAAKADTKWDLLWNKIVNYQMFGRKLADY